MWHVDLIEWEQQGSAAEACADVLLDKRWPDLIRRKAMLARLTAFAVESRPEDASGPATAARVRLADQLAQLQLYAVLSPLEKLFTRRGAPGEGRGARGDAAALLQAQLRHGAHGPPRRAIRRSSSKPRRPWSALYFQHAFDPLSRIVRESPQPHVRASALRALARVDTMEAAEFLLGILEHGAPADRVAALDGLKRSRGARFIELARSAMHTTAPEVQAALRDVLRSRGIAA